MEYLDKAKYRLMNTVDDISVWSISDIKVMQLSSFVKLSSQGQI